MSMVKIGLSSAQAAIEAALYELKPVSVRMGDWVTHRDAFYGEGTVYLEGGDHKHFSVKIEIEEKTDG